MTSKFLPASFGSASDVAAGPSGQLAHHRTIEHTERLERRLFEVRPGVWSLIGNGLSNQNFVEGPEGLIVIDTGESREEMAWALAAVREHTDAPIAAVIYTHFHYVGGTAALWAEDETPPPIWGHAGIVGNRERAGVILSAAGGRGLVHQFGMLLDHEGPDGLVNGGLGIHYRNPEHAPFTDGFVAPDHTFTEATSATIAGLRVEFTPAPSDADDSVTVWFEELGVAVNNILWPLLFNVFAIRGEEYRDPRVLLAGLDHLGSLGADHLVGCHGPPLSGSSQIATDVERYRDSIQFMWDQSVRGINRGLSLGELTEFVQLPEMYAQRYLTSQFYGLVEHHVRQIHAGLRGWFDGDEESLLPVPPLERANKLIVGFGGKVEVRRHVREALSQDDLRWALELATWLVRCELGPDGRADGGTLADRAQLAEVLRQIAQRTTAANVRNWCLTRARELEGSLDLSRFRTHRFGFSQVLAQPPEATVHAMRVLIDPASAEGVNAELRWNFEGHDSVGLRVRNQVGVPTDGSSAATEIQLTHAAWANLLAGRTSLDEALEAGDITVTGDVSVAREVLGSIDLPAFR